MAGPTSFIRVALGAAFFLAALPACPAHAREAELAPAPDLFGTVTLPAPAAPMSERWNRVRSLAPTASLMSLVEPVSGLSRARQMLFVQSVVQRTLGYRQDREMWGEPDYWASAAETLSRGGGDCEDLAIVKYQALLALGFNPADMVLSVGRDLSRGDHALLLVRDAGRWWVLDDALPRPVRPEQRTGFEPVMSFSGTAAQWLHGRPNGASARADPAPVPAARR